MTGHSSIVSEHSIQQEIAAGKCSLPLNDWRSSLYGRPGESDFPQLDQVPGYRRLVNLVAAGQHPDVLDVMQALADVSLYCGSGICEGRCSFPT
jgi:hypothetical protein